MNLDDKLSKNFTLRELVHSDTAIRYGIKEQFNPPQNVIINLKQTTLNFLQPIRELFKQSITVTSGWRSPEVNRLNGGEKLSQHTTGEAVDFVQSVQKKGKKINEDLVLTILNNIGIINFDQLIFEGVDTQGNVNWIHGSWTDLRKNRKQILIMTTIRGKREYFTYDVRKGLDLKKYF